MNSTSEARAAEGAPVPGLKHELHTHVTSIIGYIELIREVAAAENNGELAPDLRRKLEKVWMAVNELAVLVENGNPMWGIGYPIGPATVVTHVRKDDLPQAKPNGSQSGGL